MQLSNEERFAALMAFDKALSPQVKDAKAEARAKLMSEYADSGADRRAFRVNGEKVGEVGISYSHAHPVIKQEQMQHALNFLQDIGMVERVPAKGWEEHFTQAGDAIICKDTGEVVDFLLWEPERAKGAAVRGFKPQKVLDAFNGRLDGDALAGLLEGE